MKITRTDVSPTEIKLLINAGEAELTPLKDSVVHRLAHKVKLPGFREGKAPQALVEKNLDQAQLQNDFLDEAMTQLYAKATIEEDIRPVTRPKVDIKKFVPFTELEFEVTTGIVGKLNLPDYKKTTVKRDKVTITAKDVDGVIASLQTRMADKKEVSRAAKLKDEAVIDFKGIDAKKKPIEGAEGKDYPLQLGSGAFIPGFEEEVVGLKASDEKTFDIVFPKDYGSKALAGSTVTFTITVKKVNELIEPAVNDEFAAKVGPFKTVAELKEDVKKQLTTEREREAEGKLQDEVVKAISDKTKVELPDELIDQQVQHNIEEVKRNLTYSGQTYQEFLAAEGKTEAEYAESLKPQATEQLKGSLILSEIADIENITVEPEELDIRIQLLKGQYNDPAMQAELDKKENRRDIASRLLTEKVIDYVTSFAK